MSQAKRALRALLRVGWKPVSTPGLTKDLLREIRHDRRTINNIAGESIAQDPLDDLWGYWAKFSRPRSVSGGGMLAKYASFYGTYHLEDDEELPVVIAPELHVRGFWDGTNR